MSIAKPYGFNNGKGAVTTMTAMSIAKPYGFNNGKGAVTTMTAMSIARLKVKQWQRSRHYHDHINTKSP
jgi:hypothetical protein